MMTHDGLSAAPTRPRLRVAMASGSILLIQTAVRRAGGPSASFSKRGVCPTLAPSPCPCHFLP